MKKLMMTLAMALTMTVAFAEGEENEKTNRMATYNLSVNMTMLSKALHLNSDQRESVEVVHDLFVKEMMNAGAAAETDRERMMNKAITHDLAYMRSILTEEQYKRYLTILNATLKNRGLK